MENQEILNLNKRLQDISEILKSEFFGIDKQIDLVITNIKPWLFFPNLQTRPCIINLWGMTGVGKTSLINRLLELLDLEKFKVYFNFAQIGEKNNWEIQDDLHDNLSSMGITTPVFIYDEFQYAKTINEDGHEIDKPALKVFWELLDSGIYTESFDWSVKSTIKNLHRILEFIKDDPNVEIEKGELIKGQNEVKRLSKNHRVSSKMWESYDDALAKLERETIFSDDQKDHIYRVLNIYMPDRYPFVEDVYKTISECNKQQLFDFITEVKNLMLKNKKIDFSKSLIFVVGNLDEAYSMTFDQDPDMDPDQFYEKTQEITIVQIKKSLQTRFRNEQIARLGNIHLIYPSFSKKTFCAIINKNLSDYVDQVFDLTGKKLILDNSINEMIYKDSVFPTQGTRPIFTSIHELVKTKLSDVIYTAVEKNIDFDSFKYKFDEEKSLFRVQYILDKNVVGKIKLPQALRLNDLRKSRNDERQTLTAVHEAGHAVVMIDLMREIPNKLISQCTNSDMGGYTLNDHNPDHIMGYNDMIIDVAINLAGKEAERMIFGDNYATTGCYHDYKTSILLISDFIRICGFGPSLAPSGWMESQLNLDAKVYDNVCGDDKINEIFEEARKMCFESLDQQKLLLVKLSEHLSDHTQMQKDEIKEFIADYYLGNFEEATKTTYRDKLQAVINECSCS